MQVLHFSEDCDFKEKYITCETCLEVIEVKFLEHHVLGFTCLSKFIKIKSIFLKI